jgi:hypothetical protein
MHATYTFDFLETVSNQLVEALESLSVTRLADNVEALAKFQEATGFVQGVYVLYEAGVPRYLGKADNVHNRLRQHLRKLSGRLNVILEEIGYKALLLDSSMSTAANEAILIALFQARHDDMWNGRGFGPKDPGRERDTTRPSRFDRDHPIDTAFAVPDVNDEETVESLFNKMKIGLPYVFRFDIGLAAETKLCLSGVPRTAQALLHAALRAIPKGMHGAILAHGIVVYDGPPRSYPPGVLVFETGVAQ